MADFSKNRRRNYFIDKSFQSKFIIKFCILLLIASILTGICTYYFNQQTATVAFENLRVVVKSTSDFILPAILWILIIVTMLVSLATIAVTLFASHKIAGPLYKLNMELEKIKNGDLSSPIRIRSKDQLQVLAQRFEEVRLFIRGSLHQLQDSWPTTKLNLQKLLEGISDKAAKKDVEEAIKKIDFELGRYKTD